MKIAYEFNELTVNPSKANISALNTITLYTMLVCDYVDKLKTGAAMSDDERRLHDAQLDHLADIGAAIYEALRAEGVYDNV